MQEQNNIKRDLGAGEEMLVSKKCDQKTKIYVSDLSEKDVLRRVPPNMMQTMQERATVLSMLHGNKNKLKTIFKPMIFNENI